MRRDVFTRHFTKKIGICPKKFLNNLLIRRVSELLASTDQKIKDIAAEFEFGNAFYFSRFFKNQTGMAPREYRQRMNGEKSHRGPRE